MMKICNALIYDLNFQNVISGSRVTLKSDTCYLRFEPAFVFDRKNVTILLAGYDGRVFYQKSIITTRATVCEFVELPTFFNLSEFVLNIADGDDKIYSITIRDQRTHKTTLHAISVAQAARNEYYTIRNYYLSLPFKSLLGFASRALKSNANKLIFITGSVGKTSTKEFLGHLCNGSGGYTSTDSWNFPHEIAIQIILNASISSTLVFEVALCRDLPEFAEFLAPDILIFTHLGISHLYQFTTLESIALQKASLARNMRDNSLIIYNSDIPLICESLKKAVCNSPRFQSFGKAGSDLNIESRGTSYIFKQKRKSFTLKIPFGKINPYSIASSHLVCEELKIDVKNGLQSKVNSFPGIPGRFQVINYKNRILVNDSYNANPVSVQNFLQQINMTYSDKTCLIVLGEMLDLGQATINSHIEIMKAVEFLKGCHVIFVGEIYFELLKDFKPCNIKYDCVPQKDIEYVFDCLSLADVYAYKGSFGTGLLRLDNVIYKYLDAVVNDS
jgi:UDP-N-acetylmuramyl pentapeptide synthase